MMRCVSLFIIFYCFTKCINCQQLFYKNTYIYAVHREDSLGFNDLSKTEGLDFRTDVVVNGVDKTLNGGDTVGEEGGDINGKGNDNIGRELGAGIGKELIFNARRRVSMDTGRRGGYIRKRDADEDEEEDGGGDVVQGEMGDEEEEKYGEGEMKEGGNGSEGEDATFSLRKERKKKCKKKKGKGDSSKAKDAKSEDGKGKGGEEDEPPKKQCLILRILNYLKDLILKIFGKKKNTDDKDSKVSKGSPEGKEDSKKKEDHKKKEDRKKPDEDTWLGRFVGKQNEYRKRHIAK